MAEGIRDLKQRTLELNAIFTTIAKQRKGSP